ncbi:hypothetical protein CHS0354_018471 [Potamilus streckersoni]|uniref:PDZ domain-containing protein n=1 Tax=Potamilus streckersoni TaxID=2493646 RepID=A0AAE0TAN8_9BIVA|nr:hypothetical protein CHS0354_018471 [Potamilus streckersoni]
MLKKLPVRFGGSVDLLAGLQDAVRSVSVKKLLAILHTSAFLLGAYFAGSVAAELTGVFLFKPNITQQVKYTPPKPQFVDRPREFKDFMPVIIGNTFSTEAAPPDILKSEDQNAAQKSISDLQLRGTLVVDVFRAYAYIVQVSTSTEKFFSLRDQIFNTGLTLKRVEDTHVVLEQNGAEVILKYPERPTFANLNEFKAADQPVAQAPPAPGGEGLIQPAPASSAGGAPVVNIVKGKADVVVNANSIESALSNFTNLLQQARVIPRNDESGKLKGYVIRSIEKGSFYEQIGLQNNDIIKNVNGKAIDSPETALTLFQLMRNEKQINLILERNGQDVANSYADIALYGTLTSLGMIVAIGSQNVFVIKQGIRREFIFMVCLVCTLSDYLLITLGVLGAGKFFAENRFFLITMSIAGILFLTAYGAMAFYRMIKGEKLETAPEKTGNRRFRQVLLQVLAVTYLNPHVYLDTVVVLGGISSSLPADSRIYFLTGAGTSSMVWFFTIGYGAGRLTPLFRQRLTWRILNFFVGCIMWYMAWRLFLHLRIIWSPEAF